MCPTVLYMFPTILFENVYYQKVLTDTLPQYRAPAAPPEPPLPPELGAYRHPAEPEPPAPPGFAILFLFQYWWIPVSELI